MNVVREFAGLIVDLPGGRFPDDLKLGAPGRRDGVGDRDHAAEVRLANFSNVVLHDERVTYRFNVDRHGSAVVSHCSTRCDMRMRAALVFSVGEVEEPFGNVHLLDGGTDRGADG